MPQPNDTKTPPAAPPSPPAGRWITVGLVVSVVMLGGFGSWASLAPLTSASMAPGIVKVDSNRKTIQHYEGGIIREILVRDGDQVSHCWCSSTTSMRAPIQAPCAASSTRCAPVRPG